MRVLKRLGIAVLILAAGTMAIILNPTVGGSSDWRTASRASIGVAPEPAATPEAVVQVYAARTVRWRGYLGVHTWIAAKSTNAKAFTVYEVIGWRLRWGNSALSISQRVPDGRWFGNAPELLADVRGPGVDGIIDRIDAAARAYPYQDKYSVWPGPNSNTFTAYVLRSVPELRVDLPPTAIGKDYIGDGIAAAAPSGTGYQVSLFGLFGVLAGVEEGLEVNLLGLTFGIDPIDLAIKLPGFGRIAPETGLAGPTHAVTVHIPAAIAADNVAR